MPSDHVARTWNGDALVRSGTVSLRGGDMLVRLDPGEKVGLSYLLPYEHVYRITLDVESEGDLSVELFHGISAMREETAGEGKIPYGFACGRRFTIFTGNSAPGGYWYIVIRNDSKFAEVVAFDSYAEPTDDADPASIPAKVKSVKDTIVGWDGKVRKPVTVAVRPKPKGPDLYALMMAKASQKPKSS
jgi:hypothetical protein